MALVLCTGVDPVLLKTRKLILQSAGHRVITAMDESAIAKACGQHAFEVAIIGQTAPESVKRRIMMLIRTNCPAARVLELYRFSIGKILEDADAWLEVPSDLPQELAERVNAMAAKPLSQSAEG